MGYGTRKNARRITRWMRELSATCGDQYRDFVGARVDKIKARASVSDCTDRRRNRAIGEHPTTRQHDRVERSAEASIPNQLVVHELVARCVGVRLEHSETNRFACFDRLE